MRRHMLFAASLALLAACGGGGGGGDTVAGGGGGGGIGVSPPPPPPPGSPPVSPPSPPPADMPTAADASRLLTQATFGPTDASITALTTAGISAWINSQEAAAMPATSHRAYIDARYAQLGYVGKDQFYETWWRQAASDPGQLRQRVAFALSEIFVISFNDDSVEMRGGASYYDMLEADAFVNFRKLLEDVTLHPMMGRYLTYLANQKEDAAGTRTPDENYAREVMQLMTIGLEQLNQDGSPKRDGAGVPLPTYASADVKGLAKVFTGLSWYTTSPSDGTFLGYVGDGDRAIKPMMFYPKYHSISAKTFLGVTIPASASANGAGDLKIALDTIFNHPNVGPFVSLRLIQRLVTSNPSPAYISRVAGVFNNNGSGVRGDMGAVIKAILSDPEARDASLTGSATFGKVREPLIRATNWMRAFGAISQSGQWLANSSSSNPNLGQSPLSAGSVFNFFRPGYIPPDTTELGSRDYLAPEFQIVDEVSVATWINSIQSLIDNMGIGPGPQGGTGPDVKVDYSHELALAGTPQALVDRLNLLLFGGSMSSTLQTRLVAAINAVPSSNQLARVKTAIFLSMISPEYLVQR